jgi:uncharacterized damage-inducible protein DinB
MTLNEFVQSAVETSFDEERWYAGLLRSLSDLTAEQAAWKPAPDRNSIWQIVRHVTRWKEAVLSDWDGKTPDYDQVSAGDWQPASGDDAAWRAEVSALEQVTRDLAGRWSALGEEDLLAIPPGRKRPPLQLVFDLTSHDAYHAGQIRLLRRLQGV